MRLARRTGELRAPATGETDRVVTIRTEFRTCGGAAGRCGRGGVMTDLLEERSRGKAYGEDLRRRAVVAVLERGMTLQAASRQFDVSWRSIASWIKRYRERGDLRPDPRGGDLQSWRIEAERGADRAPAGTAAVAQHPRDPRQAGRRGPRVRNLHRAALPETPRPRTRTPPCSPRDPVRRQTPGRAAQVTADCARGAGG